MNKSFGFFVKVFSQDKYREDFLNGDLYMNTIKYFRDYEEAQSGNIGDKNEGVSAWLVPEGLQIKFNPPGMEPFTITSKDLAAPVVIKRNAHENINVLCLTYLHSHGISLDDRISEDDFNKLQRYFTLPEEAKNIGEFAVIIPSVPEFISRVRKAADKLISSGAVRGLIAKEVTYYDKEKSLSLENFDDAVFHKQSEYSHQSEYRVCLNRDAILSEPYTFKIGSLRDIALSCQISEVNSMYELQKYLD
ncbi:hypothetical protein [Pantoea sp. ANP04]|uniref:hypothetical protein n=1 Tax=Pantoea sp. ANP04 TaxID=3064896 RepID=UPI0035C5CEE8